MGVDIFLFLKTIIKIIIATILLPLALVLTPIVWFIFRKQDAKDVPHPLILLLSFLATDDII